MFGLILIRLLISVLEASDVENLIDQFEAASELEADDDDDDVDDDNDDDLEDQETASNILAAVHSHFVASDTSGTKKRSPRIGGSSCLSGGQRWWLKWQSIRSIGSQEPGFKAWLIFFFPFPLRAVYVNLVPLRGY